jgi:hypothetical protein|eukprot:SAG25_NODE_400_length_8482_cov_73.962901_3_plen_123_part_00
MVPSSVVVKPIGKLHSGRWSEGRVFSTVGAWYVSRRSSDMMLISESILSQRREHYLLSTAGHKLGQRRSIYDSQACQLHHLLPVVRFFVEVARASALEITGIGGMWGLKSFASEWVIRGLHN